MIAISRRGFPIQGAMRLNAGTSQFGIIVMIQWKLPCAAWEGVLQSAESYRMMPDVNGAEVVKATLSKESNTTWVGIMMNNTTRYHLQSHSCFGK